MQDLIRKLPGVVNTRVGYTGGDVPNANLSQPWISRRGHRDRVRADTYQLSRPAGVLLPDSLSHHVESPRQRRRSVVSLGDLLYLEAQRNEALRTIDDVNASGLWPGRVVTKVSPAGEFWEAEPEHQDYLERYPHGYTCHFPRTGWTLPRRAGVAT